MQDMWKVPGRVRPTALDYQSIMEGFFQPPALRNAASQANGDNRALLNGGANGHASGSTTLNLDGQSKGNARQLRDQKELSVKENLELFIDRYAKF